VLSLVLTLSRCFCASLVIGGAAWLIGSLGMHVGWLVVVVLVFIAISRQRMARLAGWLRIERSRLLRTGTRAESSSLQLQHAETAEWLNAVIERYWYFYEDSLSHTIQTSLDEVLAGVKVRPAGNGRLCLPCVS
jgi:Ca2+-dependent lipid-binding protein